MSAALSEELKCRYSYTTVEEPVPMVEALPAMLRVVVVRPPVDTVMLVWF